MKVKAIVKKILDDKTWEETYSIPRDGESAQAVIDQFNRTLKPGEAARELVSWEYMDIALREDIELFLTGSRETVVLASNRIAEYFEPGSEFITFLNEAPVGAAFSLELELDCHFDFAILINPGQGGGLGIQADLPTTEPEDCSECGESASNMVWDEGSWKCPDCGEVQ